MWRFFIFLSILCLQAIVTCVRVIEPGPKYPPTKGEVWPEPQHQVKEDIYYKVTTQFHITITNHTCHIVDKSRFDIAYAIVEMSKFIKHNEDAEAKHHRNPLYKGKLHSFLIELNSECEFYPHYDMDEAYNLTVAATSVLSSNSIWGVLRGIETFIQLFYFSDDHHHILVNATKIVDYPAYKHRGLLIDTGRHYIHRDKILTTIKAMAMNKMNVLHWHIVDDQSFPYQSERFPGLSEKGSFDPSLVYSKDDVYIIIEFARLRGVRVIPEFDVPGHVRSWGCAFPQLLTECYDLGKIVGLGPLDPINNGTYSLLQQLYEEVRESFADSYLHIGGDEVDLDCWQSNPKIQEYMNANDLTTSELHARFMSNIFSILPNRTKSIVWQEVFDEKVPLPKETLVQVWKYEWVDEMDKILKSGHRVVFSSSWYLDYLNQGWETFYRADPRSMVYSWRYDDAGLEDIVGGEACMWGEMVDDNNFISRTWPRASAVAERLWSGMDYKDPAAHDPVTDHVRRRIEELACRMARRGIEAEPPNGPGFCTD